LPRSSQSRQSRWKEQPRHVFRASTIAVPPHLRAATSGSTRIRSTTNIQNTNASDQTGGILMTPSLRGPVWTKITPQTGSSFGSDSHSMILDARVALFSEGNQHHGEKFAIVVVDPGGIGGRGHRRERRSDYRYRPLRGASATLPSLPQSVEPGPQPLCSTSVGSSLYRDEGRASARGAPLYL
jgi:hypothetical protein